MTAEDKRLERLKLLDDHIGEHLRASERTGELKSARSYGKPLDLAEELYEFFVEQVRATGLKVETGLFQEHMLVEIHNDGPVTIWMDTDTL